MRIRTFVVMLVLASLALGSARGATAKTVYTGPSGSDGAACAQVTKTQPRRTINGGIACLSSGDTLEIAAGEYPELVVAGTGTQDSVRQVQPNTYAIPSGSSTTPTTLTAAQGATVWLRPFVTYPGGGGVITTTAGAEHLRFDGLNLDGQDLHSSALYLKGSDMVFTRAEVTRGKNLCVSSQTDSARITFSYLHVHHCGLTVTKEPMPHAMYICGRTKPSSIPPCTMPQTGAFSCPASKAALPMALSATTACTTSTLACSSKGTTIRCMTTSLLRLAWGFGSGEAMGASSATIRFTSGGRWCRIPTAFWPRVALARNSAITSCSSNA